MKNKHSLTGDLRFRFSHGFFFAASLGLLAALGVEPAHAGPPDGLHVVAWGQDIGGSLNLPSGLTDPVAISSSAGLPFFLALNADGTVVAWGNNGEGQTNVPPGLTNVVGIAVGSVHGLALKADGTVVGWGDDMYGEIDVPQGLSNVVAIAAAGAISMALQNDGLVTAWGIPYYGQTNVPTSLSNVVAIAAGGTGCLALSADGRVTAWGGITNVPPGLTHVISIATGVDFYLAATSSGNVVAWGEPYLEDITPEELSAITNVPSNVANVVALSAGEFGALALNDENMVVGWGSDFEDTNIPPGLTNVVAVSAGAFDGLALAGSGFPVVQPMPQQFAYSGTGTIVLESGGLGGFPLGYQWQFDGTNIPGANLPWLVLTNVQTTNAGNYTVIITNDLGAASNSAPLTVVNSGPIILQQPAPLQLPPGNNFTFSVKATGSQPMSYQWQFNGTNIPGATGPALIVPGAQLPAAGYYGVVLTNPYGTVTSSNAALSFSISSVAVWGGPSFGERDMPTNLTDVTAVSAGAYHNLALYFDGTVEGWGDDSHGQIDIPEGLANVTAIAAGADHSLALRADGTVVGWGDDTYGEIDVPTGLSNVRAIAAGGFSSMALQSNGLVTVWGQSSGGETEVPPGLTNVTAIAAGGSHCLALKADGTVVAWGDDGDGQIDVPQGLSNVVAIGAGPVALVSLAVKADGTVAIWGYTAPGLDVPPGLSNVVSAVAGPYFCLAMLSNHTVTAWGQDFENELEIPPGLTNVTGIGTGYANGLVLDPAGGVITLVPVQEGQVGGVGYLQATLAPAAAVAAGAGWGIIGQPYFSSNTNFTVAVTAGQSVAIAFQPADGWVVPSSREVTVPLGGVTNLSISYAVQPPMMTIAAGAGIGIAGTSNTTYRIEYSSTAAVGSWLPLSTNTIPYSGFDLVLPWPPTNGPAAFYRAVWLQ